MSLPYFKFFCNDWLGSQNIELMTPEEEGAYIHLLARAWNSENCSLPDDDNILATLSRLNSNWMKSAARIRERFIAKDGKLFPKKLNRLFKEAEEVSDSKKTGAEERWGKEKYFESAKISYEQLRNDEKWIIEQKKYHPRLDILLTLEKAYIQFWGTDAGWEYSKKKKSKTKNWKLTFENSLSQKINQVWLQNESGKSSVDIAVEKMKREGTYKGI
jgi:uncharacterized protein YdaU (DUF1376 family)